MTDRPARFVWDWMTAAVEVVGRAAEDGELSNGHARRALLVAFNRSRYASTDGTECRPGSRRLAHETRYGRRYVAAADADLVELGLLARTGNADRGVFVYALTIPSGAPMTAPLDDDQRRALTAPLDSDADELSGAHTNVSGADTHSQRRAPGPRQTSYDLPTVREGREVGGIAAPSADARLAARPAAGASPVVQREGIDTAQDSAHNFPASVEVDEHPVDELDVDNARVQRIGDAGKESERPTAAGHDDNSDALLALLDEALAGDGRNRGPYRDAVTDARRNRRRPVGRLLDQLGRLAAGGWTPIQLSAILADLPRPGRDGLALIAHKLTGAATIPDINDPDIDNPDALLARYAAALLRLTDRDVVNLMLDALETWGDTACGNRSDEVKTGALAAWEQGGHALRHGSLPSLVRFLACRTGDPRGQPHALAELVTGLEQIARNQPTEEVTR